MSLKTKKNVNDYLTLAINKALEGNAGCIYIYMYTQEGVWGKMAGF